MEVVRSGRLWVIPQALSEYVARNGVIGEKCAALGSQP
jgi:hypothetical protein